MDNKMDIEWRVDERKIIVILTQAKLSSENIIRDYAIKNTEMFTLVNKVNFAQPYYLLF